MPAAPDSQPFRGLARHTDAELARRARAGSLPGFAELVRRFEGRLFNFLLRRVGSPQDAEDLTQETFVRAWQRIDQYDQRWRFSTWLFTIGNRLAITHIRRRKPVTVADFTHRQATAESADPARRAAARERQGLIWDLARRVLTETQHATLWLRYAEEMPIVEVARILGKSQLSVRVTLSRARDTLAQHERLLGRPAQAASGGIRSTNAAEPQASPLTGDMAC